jgi:transcriptional regulator with XRE-family HTH domain
MAEMKRRKCTQRELAERIGVAELTLSRKLNGNREFNLKEMRKVQSVFDNKLLDYLFVEID